MLGQRRRRWPNIESTFGQRIVFAGRQGQETVSQKTHNILDKHCCTIYIANNLGGHHNFDLDVFIISMSPSYL